MAEGGTRDLKQRFKIKTVTILLKVFLKLYVKYLSLLFCTKSAGLRFKLI